MYIQLEIKRYYYKRPFKKNVVKPKQEKTIQKSASLRQKKRRTDYMCYGRLIALSSIKWMVKSQTMQNSRCCVTLSLLGLVCRCPVNAGLMICKHCCRFTSFLKSSGGQGRAGGYESVGKKYNARKDCQSTRMVKNGRHRYKRKGFVQ